MIDKSTALERCNDIVALARRLGADAADAVMRADSAEGVSIRLGKLEDVSRSESEAIGLRVFVGQRSASVSSSDFSPASLEALAEQAIAMARLAPEDRYAGLAPRDRLAKAPFPDLELVDPVEPTPEELREAALEVEQAARGVSGVTNSNGGEASFSRAVVAFVTSHGFAQTYGGTAHSLGASVIAGEGSAMQTDHCYRSARHRADLPPAVAIGTKAGERAVARVGPISMPSGPMPVVFDPRVGSGLVGHLLGGMSGAAIARKTSFLLGHEHESLFDPAIRIVEEPLRPRGHRSRPFDGEGLACETRALVEDGHIFGWLTNSAAARQLDAPLTGHAGRGIGGAPGIHASNVHCEAGDCSPDELMGDIVDGLYVTQLFGQGVNLVTGDYSRGASGFRIRNGAIAEPVAEITVAGNLIAMFAAMRAADDLEFLQSVNVPTLRIDGMTVAGS